MECRTPHLLHVMVGYFLAGQNPLLSDHQSAPFVEIGTCEDQSLSFDSGGTLVATTDEGNHEQNHAGAHRL